MVCKFDRVLYPKEAVLKAAYSFIDRFYFHLETLDNEYIVEITPKESAATTRVKEEFENELLAQSVRYYVSQETKKIRELIVARAIASTIVEDDESQVNEEDTTKYDDQLNAILKDWFSK